MLQRQRLAAALSLAADGLLERQLVPLPLAFHVPVRIGARHRIAQQHDQLHRRVVAPDALRRGLPVHVNRRCIAEQPPLHRGLEIGVVSGIIDLGRGEVLLGIEEVDLLHRRHADLRMLVQIGG
jgi:hypothetical protein